MNLLEPVESFPLVRQGITTYEYVVAMRAMSEAPPEQADEEGQNVLYSPTNSATTGLSVGSSLGIGLQYKGVWCTPPRVFIDQQVSLCIMFIFPVIFDKRMNQ